MKKQLQLNRNNKLHTFFDMFGEAFSNSVGTIIGKPLIYELNNTFESDIDDIAKENKGKAGIYFNDAQNSITGLLIFDIKLITAFADIMLMGEGNGVEELNAEITDAVKELSSQAVSSVNVPFQEKFGVKLSLEVVKVEKIEDTINLQVTELIIQDYNITYNNNNESFTLVISKTIEKLLGKDEENVENNDFDFEDDEPDFEAVDFKSSKNSGQNYDGNIEMLLDVEIPVSVRIGSTKMFLKDIVNIGPGNIVELDNYADEPVELLINNKPIARGEVVIVDGFFGIRIKEIISREERLKKLRDS